MATRAAVQVVLTDVKRRIWHDSKRIHVLGQLIITTGDYATELTVGDLLLVSGEHRQVATILTDTTLTVTNAFSNNANDLAPKRYKPAALVALAGTVNVTASATVVGVSTKFLAEIKVGDYLVIGSDTVGETRKVTAIATNTGLTVDAAFTDLADDTAPKLIRAADMVQITGSIDPAASTSVTGVNSKFLGYGLPFSLNVPGIIGNKILDMKIQGRAGYIYRYTKTPTRVGIIGGVDTTASTAVVGVATTFTKDLKVGDEVFVLNEQRFVTAITSDLALTVNRAFSDQANDTVLEKIVRSDALQDALLSILVPTTVTGGAAAASTNTVQVITGGLSKEEVGNTQIAQSQLLTTTIPNAVMDDLIEFDAILAAA